MSVRPADASVGLDACMPGQAVVEFLLALEKTMTDIPRRYLNIEELAVYLGFTSHDGTPTTKSLYRLVSDSRIPYIKPGGLDSLRFDIKAIDKWMERHAVHAKPRPAA